MYAKLYDEILADSCSGARNLEREILERSSRMLADAMNRKRYTTEAIAAIFFTGKVWRALVSDLASSENQLDEDLRARIISIGLRVLKRCETCRLTRSVDFVEIIQLTTLISAGLA